MSIKLPKYVIQQEGHKKSIWIRYGWLFFLLALLLAFFAGFFIKNNLVSLFHNSQNELLDENQKLKELNSGLIAQNSLLLTEIKVTKQALLEIQDSYNELLSENSEYQSEVSFFKNLLTSNSRTKGLRIFDIHWEKTGATQHLMKMTLAQKLQKAQPIKGNFEVIIKGQIKSDDKMRDIKVKFSGEFDFKYYQVIRHLFSFEEGFYPVEVVVELVTNERKPRTLSQNYQWYETAKTQ